MRNIILCMTLFAGAIFAQQGSMRNRLGQMNAKNLVQAQSQGGDDWSCDDVSVGSPDVGDLPECPCNFTQLPGLSAGLS